MSQSILNAGTYAELGEAMGADFAAELVTTFLSEAPSMMANLKAASADADADGYRRAAHSIKSNAEIFGAHALADMCRTMEVSGLHDDAPSIEDIEAIMLQTETALRGLLDE